MVNTIAFLLIVFGIMFLIGIAMAMIVMAVKNIRDNCWICTLYANALIEPAGGMMGTSVSA